MLQKAVFEFDNIFKDISLEERLKEELRLGIEKNFMPQKAKFKAIFRLSTQQKNGVEDLKAILRVGLENPNEDFPL